MKSNIKTIFPALLLFLNTISSKHLPAQQLTIVKSIKTYRQMARQDSSYKMTELHSIIPNLIYDMKYATDKNFTSTTLYPDNSITFLRLPVAKALYQVQQELNAKGYTLKIFDAYRPYSVTKKMWDLIKDERYVANPAKGSGHNRGLAVDLTIVDTKTGRELDMGTGFDNFTDSAHHSFNNFADAILENRRLLLQIMTRHGFQPLETEWWHYYWPNDKNYPVLDISFKQLLRFTH